MDNRLTILKLSEKAEACIKELEKEIGNYGVLIRDYQGDEGAKVTLDHEKKLVIVEINEKMLKNDSEEDINSTIAHETTHEILSFKKGHYRLNISKFGLIIGRIETMIEDIIVNKIIYEKNYRAYSPQYFDEVELEIKILHESKDVYKMYNQDPIYKNVFMVSRYIQAWGYLEYSNLNEIDKETLCKYLETFQKSYPEQHEKAKKIKEIILKNNIFKAEGYNKTIWECLEIFDFINLVYIYCMFKNKDGHFERRFIY